MSRKESHHKAKRDPWFTGEREALHKGGVRYKELEKTGSIEPGCDKPGWKAVKREISRSRGETCRTVGEMVMFLGGAPR